MKARANERGETLIEIIISIVLLGAISSAWFYTASNQSKASALNKDVVTADIVLRGYAEATKTAVRTTCTTTTPSGTSFASNVHYTPPSGYTLEPIDPDANCPVSNSTSPLSPFVKKLRLTTEFDGISRSLEIDVRSR